MEVYLKRNHDDEIYCRVLENDQTAVVTPHMYPEVYAELDLLLLVESGVVEIEDYLLDEVLIQQDLK